mgnify:CR=1 FL=1
MRRFHAVVPWLIFPAMMMGPAGCQSVPTKPAATSSAFIQGKAKVLEVSNDLGYALLSIDGKSVYGYWSAEREVARDTPMFTKSGPLAEPRSVVKEPTVIPQQFPGKAGDTIAFRGMRTGADIYLTGVQVLPQ